MGRLRNTDAKGRNFVSEKVLEVWQKGDPILEGELDLNEWRKDVCDTIMKFSAYGDTDSDFGWEIDHIIPEAKGGSDKLSNLQPMQWENNRSKGDKCPWSC